MRYALNIYNSLATSSLALWRGTWAKTTQTQRYEPIALYDMENCPYCRLVREVCTELDLPVLIYPCPKNGTRFRPKVVEMGGKAQFPYLVDPNTGTQMYESADIIEYLYRTYSKSKAPSPLAIKTLRTTSSILASGLRGTKSFRPKASTLPEHPLELWSFESSPFSRPVRELLCEMELPFRVHNLGKGQWKDFVLTEYRQRWWPEMHHQHAGRDALKARTGKVMLPYFYDPNTGEEFYESTRMLKYLKNTYGG